MDLQSFDRLVNGYRSGAFWNGLILAGWGIWLLLPFDTFSTAAPYKLMADMGSEARWGAGCLLASYMLVYGAITRKRKLMTYGAILAGFTFLLIWGSFTAHSWKTTATPVYLPLSIRCFLLSRKYSTHTKEGQDGQ